MRCILEEEAPNPDNFMAPSLMTAPTDNDTFCLSVCKKKAALWEQPFFIRVGDVLLFLYMAAVAFCRRLRMFGLHFLVACFTQAVSRVLEAVQFWISHLGVVAGVAFLNFT